MSRGRLWTSATRKARAGAPDLPKRSDEVKYTWWSYFRRARERNRGWRIDYFLVSRGLLPLVKDAELLNEIGGSDHCPITLELESE